MSQKTETAKKPVSRKDMTKWQWTLKEMSNNKTGYFLLAPFYIIFFVFTILPVILSIFFSFTDFNLLETPNFIWFDNYIRLFLEDDIFMLAIKNTLVFAAVTGPGSYLISLLMAWFINELPPKIRAVMTLIFYAPSISGNVYMVWTYIFAADSHGFLNGTLMDLGVISTPIAWLKNASYIMPIVIIVALWTSLGTSFLTFIAGFQIVDRSLYEAAAVDGVKNRWQELWFITLPYMRPQMLFGAVMAITGAFGFGGVITNLVGFPSPDYCAHTIMHHLDDYGSSRFEMGYASTIAVVLFFMMIGSNMLVRKMLGKVGK
ncbi:MAG: sugar ABC transporter permease [Fibrobacter sp.]|nr:sugar ABC transporter permease [Fibrobacter sp.]MBR2633967.1 sugar ABC transporter permease [Clostridia bacterium]